MTTQHTHVVIFGRKVDGCPRCEELKNGAAPIQWKTKSAFYRNQERVEANARARHNCKVSGCGPVCTFGDW